MARADVSVNLAAIERNVGVLNTVAGGAAVCAVVKADGYGHGMVQSAGAALAGGATHLAVATAAEAATLRAAITDGTPIHVLGALTPGDASAAIAAGASVTAWSEDAVRELEAAAQSLGRTADVHVKLDTGLGRLGTRDAAEATAVAELIAASPMLTFGGAWTHFATADERDDAFFAEQLARFRAWAEPLKDRHPEIVLHAANSAATLRDAACHFDMVRCGVAIYGLDPFGASAGAQGLDAALTLAATVAAVKPCQVGESTGYGRRFVAAAETTIATITIGYGDGYRRAFSNNADVLIDGRRCPVRGTVSMDNITVDVGALPQPPRAGDRAVLLGSDGNDCITAEELAAAAGTINYEITCGISPRPTRRWHRDGVPARS